MEGFRGSGIRVDSLVRLVFYAGYIKWSLTGGPGFIPKASHIGTIWLDAVTTLEP